MFEGAMLSNITCLSCKHQANYFEKFGDLTLDINRQMSMTKLWKRNQKAKLEDMVANYFVKENIDDFKCEKCGQRGIVKEHNIIKFPKYLIVLVKRFIFFPQPRKLENKIDFSDSCLNLGDFYFDYSNEKTNEGKNYFENEK